MKIILVSVILFLTQSSCVFYALMNEERDYLYSLEGDQYKINKTIKYGEDTQFRSINHFGNYAYILEELYTSGREKNLNIVRVDLKNEEIKDTLEFTKLIEENIVKDYIANNYLYYVSKYSIDNRDYFYLTSVSLEEFKEVKKELLFGWIEKQEFEEEDREIDVFEIIDRPKEVDSKAFVSTKFKFDPNYDLSIKNTHIFENVDKSKITFVSSVMIDGEFTYGVLKRTYSNDFHNYEEKFTPYRLNPKLIDEDRYKLSSYFLESFYDEELGFVKSHYIYDFQQDKKYISLELYDNEIITNNLMELPESLYEFDDFRAKDIKIKKTKNGLRVYFILKVLQEIYHFGYFDYSSEKGTHNLKILDFEEYEGFIESNYHNDLFIEAYIRDVIESNGYFYLILDEIVRFNFANYYGSINLLKINENLQLESYDNLFFPERVEKTDKAFATNIVTPTINSIDPSLNINPQNRFYKFEDGLIKYDFIYFDIDKEKDTITTTNGYYDIEFDINEFKLKKRQRLFTQIQNSNYKSEHIATLKIIDDKILVVADDKLYFLSKK
jgi:hypothetical protein